MLTNLQTLNIHDNFLNGTISSEIGLMASLTSLQLESNAFHGLVPASLCNLRRLSELTLCDSTGGGCSNITGVPGCLFNMGLNNFVIGNIPIYNVTLSPTGLPSVVPSMLIRPGTPTSSVSPSTPPTLVPSSPSNSSIVSILVPAKATVNASLVVLLTVLFLILLLAAGLIYFSRWDALDRKILLYVPVEKSATKPGTKSFAELAAHRKAVDDAFLAGAIPSAVLDDVEDVEFDQRSRWIRGMRRLLRCCVSKPEDLSILIAGNMLPRFLHALRRYHPWVWFFSEGSRKTTRVIRFVETFKFQLTSLFVTTVLYDINNPSPQICSNFNIHPSACLATPSNILSGAPICSYDSSSNLCTIRPPPGNASFLILVAFLTVVVMVPFNLLFTLVLTLLCSKRPHLEDLGLNSFEWLGSAEPAVSKQAVDAAEESERITAVARSIHGALNHYCERKAEGYCGFDEIKGMDLVLRKLGLVISSENKIELTAYSKLCWRSDINDCIRYSVEKSLKDAREIQLNMEQYSNVSDKESYFIQHFLINRFSFLFRVSLSRYFAHSIRDVPKTIHPILWLLGWLFIIASLIFFIAWILWWGNAHAHSSTISNWGVNFALSNLQEGFIFSMARIFFVNVLAIETIRPQLENMHKYLTAKAGKQGNKGGTTENINIRSKENDENKHFLLQYLDPLLWAAKLSDSPRFTTIADSDLSKLSDGAEIPLDDDVDEEEGRFSSVVRTEPVREF